MAKIIGGIGNSARQNRDSSRVLGGGGTAFAIKAHSAINPPYVLKKFKRPVVLAIINGRCDNSFRCVTYFAGKRLLFSTGGNKTMARKKIKILCDLGVGGWVATKGNKKICRERKEES